MTIPKLVRFFCLPLVFSPVASPAPAEDFTNALRAFLQQRVEVEKRNAGMVIGIVDEHGSWVVGRGKLDNGTDQDLNGDTLFEIGSITKTFTGLLLQDMVERGEMRLDDPVAKYSPNSVKVPARNGKQITLLHLATHTSGLPLVAYNLDPERADNPYADYTVEKMYAFLSSFKLPWDPGTQYEYSELGMELLGHAIALKAGTNYESLVVDRICRPLQMDSTRIALTPELKSRLAAGHDQLGHTVTGLRFQTLVGGSGLHSTANDLLKYLSANLGLTPSSLPPLMEKTHEVRFESMRTGVRNGLGWAVVYFPQAKKFIMHGGATPGYTTYLGFDPNRRRGVVVLSSSDDLADVGYLGMFLLASDWQERPSPHGQSDSPATAKLSTLDYGSYAGEYQLSQNFALGVLTLRMLLVNVTKAAIWVAVGLCLAGLLLVIPLGRISLLRRLRSRFAFRWRGFSFRTRCLFKSAAVLLGVLSMVLTPLVAAHAVWVRAHPVVDIRREGERLFVQCTSSARAASKVILPHITGELLPESDARFVERVSRIPLTFSRDSRGKVTRLAAPLFGTVLSFAKISDQAPAPPQPLAAISLDPKLLDACVGQYEFAPDDLFPDGIKLTLRRQGDDLVGQAADKNGRWGTFEVFPLSETDFFLTMTGVGVQLHFRKNSQGEVTSVIRYITWLPSSAGKKLK